MYKACKHREYREQVHLCFDVIENCRAFVYKKKEENKEGGGEEGACTMHTKFDYVCRYRSREPKAP